MKNSIFFYCLIAVFALFLSSCETSDESDLFVTTEIAQDEMQLMGGPQLVLPDLRVPSVTTSLNESNACSSVLSGDATCNGGGNIQFTVTGVIRNQSPVAITTPFEVQLCVNGAGCLTNTIQNLGANTSTTTSRVFSFPCAVGAPPYALIQEIVFVRADFSQVVNESNEGNNSRRYFVCRNE